MDAQTARQFTRRFLGFAAAAERRWPIISAVGAVAGAIWASFSSWAEGLGDTLTIVAQLGAAASMAVLLWAIIRFWVLIAEWLNDDTNYGGSAEIELLRAQTALIEAQRKAKKEERANEKIKATRAEVHLLSEDKIDADRVQLSLKKYDLDNYKIIIDGFVPEKAGVWLWLQVGDDGGYSCGKVDYAYSTLNTAEVTNSCIVLAENLAANSHRPGRIEITLYGVRKKGAVKKISFVSYVFNSMNMLSKREGIGAFTGDSDPINQVMIGASDGNIKSAKISLLGN